MDRLYRGFVAGVAGGIIMNVSNLISFNILNLTTLRFLDWMGVMLYGTLPKTFGQEAYALFIHLLFTGTLGVLFTLLIRELSTSRSLLLKGLLFGIITGVFLYAIPVIFGIQNLEFTPLKTVISNHFGGALWGITTAYTISWLDGRYKIINE